MQIDDSEGAFDLIQNLKNIQTRSAIEEEMKKKYEDILKVYSDEVNKMRELFVKDQKHPPITKGKPPKAGAISWSEFIFKKIQQPILKFKTRDNLLT